MKLNWNLLAFPKLVFNDQNKMHTCLAEFACTSITKKKLF